MSFEYNPKEIKSEFTVLNNGEYECEIVGAMETVSKAGNDMIKLVLCLYGNDGEQVRVYDYIVNPNTIYKLKSICRCCNIEFDGVLDEQLLVGKRMRVLTKVDPERTVEGKTYSERNSIVKYVSGIETKSVVQDAKPADKVSTSAAPVPDDLPF
tara:strand:+ start:277 stop:738 length:462 start_codon:yes stop_codon:yes gene_type:complete